MSILSQPLDAALFVQPLDDHLSPGLTVKLRVVVQEVHAVRQLFSALKLEQVALVSHLGQSTETDGFDAVDAERP